MTEQKIFTLGLEENIAIVTFNDVNAAMNTWSDDAIESFFGILEELEGLEGKAAIHGAIFISGKPNTFLAGADLNVLAAKERKLDVMKDIEIFQLLLNRLSSLKIRTLAAINGHCLGGGFEFSLACSARIARESKTTSIGLPETQVNLFPAGGGTQRLTRLIGYPAVDLILTGKNLTAKEAYDLGAIDKYISEDSDLLHEAKGFINEIIEGSIKLNRITQDLSDIDSVVAAARENIMKRNKGRLLLGPEMALKAIQEGAKLSLSEGLEVEKKYFIDAALSKESKGSINWFFLNNMSNKPQKFMSKDYVPEPINKVAVLGFGSMGRGIVIDILRHMQVPVIVKDVPEALETGKAFVAKILTGMVEKKRLKVPVDELMSLLTCVTDYTKDFKDVDVVVEAVFEDISVKDKVYKELCSVVPADCVIVSNTSFLSIDELAKSVAVPERFAGLHFFSPVWLMELVEVVKGKQSSQNTIDKILNFVASIRKRPLICNDSPGFVVNAVLDPLLLNALRYLEEGNSIEKIDKAMVAFGMPLGPIKLADEVGIDVSYHIFKSRGVEQKTIENMYKDGRYGLKKSGKGFFLQDGSVDPQALALIHKGDFKPKTEEEIANGILEDMVRIGGKLLDNKIVDDPRMIDIGILWGAGYPRDKGGPMKWADLTGISEKLFGKRFY